MDFRKHVVAALTLKGIFHVGKIRKGKWGEQRTKRSHSWRDAREHASQAARKTLNPQRRP